MKIRIISALILAPLIILAIFLLPFPLFMTVVAAIVLLAFWEWGQFISLANRNKAMLPGMICFRFNLQRHSCFIIFFPCFFFFHSPFVPFFFSLASTNISAPFFFFPLTFFYFFCLTSTDISAPFFSFF